MVVEEWAVLRKGPRIKRVIEESDCPPAKIYTFTNIEFSVTLCVYTWGAFSSAPVAREACNNTTLDRLVRNAMLCSWAT